MLMADSGELKPGDAELLEAQRLVNGDRQADYGSPADNYRDIAAVWSGILGQPVTARQAALMMVGLKLAREAHKPKRDNIVDAHGYLLVYSHITVREPNGGV